MFFKSCGNCIHICALRSLCTIGSGSEVFLSFDSLMMVKDLKWTDYLRIWEEWQQNDFETWSQKEGYC